MKCKKCGYEWQSYGESITCPGCGTSAVLTQSEMQTLWEEAYEAEKIKDFSLRAACYLTLAERGDARAQYALGECLRRGVGVREDSEAAMLWYRAAARRLLPAAAYRLALALSAKESLLDRERQVLFWLRVAAELGDGDAAYALYTRYERGERVAPSHRHALFWLTRAAKGGHGTARLTLAKMYLSGVGVEKNPAAARYFFKDLPTGGLRMRVLSLRLGSGDCEEPTEILLPTREEERLALGREAEAAGEHAIASHVYFFASRGGNAEATYRLGRFYEEGLGVPKSPEEARRRYGVAAQKGHKEAVLRLGTLAEAGIGGPQDAGVAIDCYTRLEQMGEAEGSFRLGELYREGKLLPASLTDALRHYKIAAKQSHEGARRALEALRRETEAVYNRALALEERGEDAAALSAFRAAAEMGHAAAAATVGLLLEQKATKPKERKEVFTYYEMAAQGGHIAGIFRLGVCYSRGFGVKQNYSAAIRLLEIAAKQSYAGASEELAALKARKYRRAARRFYSISSVLYRKGKVDEALRFRNIAAKLGSARAMYLLGCHLEFGDGVPADRVKAAAWYTRAANAGFDPSRGDLKGGFLRARKRLILSKQSQG